MLKAHADAAALLMVEMGHLDQEELRTVLLNTKNQIEAIVTNHWGSIDRSLVRVSEIYKPALRLFGQAECCRLPASYDTHYRNMASKEVAGKLCTEYTE